jgi:hypothetical protein
MLKKLTIAIKPFSLFVIFTMKRPFFNSGLYNLTIHVNLNSYRALITFIISPRIVFRLNGVCSNPIFLFKPTISAIHAFFMKKPHNVILRFQIYMLQTFPNLFHPYKHCPPVILYLYLVDSYLYQTIGQNYLF